MTPTEWNGKPISKPGWYSGIPLEKYHSAGICNGPAVSSSNLRRCVAKSPAHMYAQWCENPNAEPPKATAAMNLGTLAHHMLLDRDGFLLKYVAQPPTYRDTKTAEVKPWNNNANYCKAWNAEQRAAGLNIVSTEDLNAVVAMSEALALVPMVNDDLLRGHVECSGFFKDKETGLWVKVRPDVIPQTVADFVDLKTTNDVTTIALMSTIRTFGYHQQGALIWEACEALDQQFDSFAVVFVETANPFCARAAAMVKDDLALGRQQNRWAIRQVAHCLQAKHWPGPGEDDDREIGLSHAERERILTFLKREGLA